MIKLMKLAAIAFAAAAVVSSPSPGAVKKPAPKKPPAKAPAKPSATNKATAGTTQLKGSEPKFGETWTLGKIDPWNFTLDSAEYMAEQLKIGDYYPVGDFDVKLDEVSTATSGTFGDLELEEGNYWLILKLTARNETAEKALLRYDTFLPKLTDEDGVEIERAAGTMYSASRNTDLDTRIDPGQEMKFRYVFQVAGDQKLKLFTIQQDEECRAYVYDASSWGK